MYLHLSISFQSHFQVTAMESIYCDSDVIVVVTSPEEDSTQLYNLQVPYKALFFLTMLLMLFVIISFEIAIHVLVTCVEVWFDDMCAFLETLSKTNPISLDWYACWNTQTHFLFYFFALKINVPVELPQDSVTVNTWVPYEYDIQTCENMVASIQSPNKPNFQRTTSGWLNS